MISSGLSIDHIFTFVEIGAPEAKLLEASGFKESYRRKHPGQGTENVCYCFENMYLELLWKNETDPIISPSVKETNLQVRSDWKNTGGSPFGVSIRNLAPDTFAFWPYQPPYLPTGKTIPIAEISRSIHVPFTFAAMGSKEPQDWDAAILQDAPFNRVHHVKLHMPQSSSYQGFIDRVGLSNQLTVLEGQSHQLDLTFAGKNGRDSKMLSLPDLIIT